MRNSIVSLLLVLSISCSERIEKNDITNNIETKPHDLMFMQRAYPLGQIKTDAYTRAIQWKKSRTNVSKSSVVWEFSGPVNIGGRITDIEIPSTQANTYYLGAASGGVFKTIDAGTTWVPIFDDQKILSIGDIEISKNDNDLIWTGTGEVNAGGGSLAYDGDGIYKSTDAGVTWENKGLPDVGSISKILIDPTDDNIVFASAMGPLFRNDSNRGVYRSINGGNTWEQKLFVSDSTGIVDMAIHPTNGAILYATSWERIRRPNRRQYGGETSGLYRSNDGGDSWAELTNGLPTNATDKGRISIDISQSNPNVLYARYADANGSIQGVYKTSDGGDNWVQVNSSQLTNVGFHWWFRGIYIDPNDENILYNVDFIVEKSTDGGNNWSVAFPNVHVDQHALAFNPNINGEVLLGNDGGFYKSSNDGVSSVKNLDLPITQFYRFYVDAQNGNKIYGGSQDNSTMRTTTGGLDDWNIIFGGDGFQPLVDPTNTNVIYALSQRGNLVKSINNGSTFNSALSGVNNADRKNWDTPVTFDPTNSQTLYLGTEKVYKTTNAAANWTAISPDLSNGNSTGNLAFGTVISIDVSSLDNTIIYAGTDDGNVWITQNSGTSWDLISAALPNRWVTKVLADPVDVNTVYVTFSGYRFGEDFGHVYRSIDAGSNWTDISSSLPDIPVNDIVKDGFGNLFLATDVGVFGSDNEGTSWDVIGINMPSVVVTDLHLDMTNDLLYAATYGRSSYKLDISSDVLSIENPGLNSQIKLYPNPTSKFITISLGANIQDADLQIYDQLGRRVLSKKITESDIKVSVQRLKSGVYFAKIKKGGLTASRKFIVN